MAWYKVGTISVTNNSATVTGVGTAWVGAVLRGEGVVMPNGVLYEIDLVNSGTSITLARPYTGPTAAGQAYSICPIQDYIKLLASQAAELLNAVNDTVTGVFGVGSANLPSIRTSGDPDTGLNLLGNNELSLVTAGVDRFKIGATGTPTGTTSDYLLSRTNHTGTQLASTISDFGAAALAQMQLYGIGAAIGSTVTDLNALRTGGLFVATVAASTASGLPLALGHTVVHASGSSGSAMQFASPITTGAANRWRLWSRQMIADGWSSWRELAFLDSPAFTGIPTAPTPAVGTNTTQVQTTAGALAQMQSFGLGGKAPVVPAGSNFLEFPWKTGAYSLAGTYPNLPFGGITGQMIVTTRLYAAGAAVVFLVFSTADLWIGNSSWTTSNPDGSVVIGSANSITWQRITNPDSPAFTGTPSTPNLKFGNIASADVNTLDYYEEGTFSPTLYGKTTAGANTYAANVGRYTRTGNRVFWEARFQLATSSGMTGQLSMLGLPFNVVNNSSARGAVTIGYYAGFADTAVYDLRAFHNHNTTSVDILKRSIGMTVSGAFPSEEVLGTAQLYMSGNYSVS